MCDTHEGELTDTTGITRLCQITDRNHCCVLPSAKTPAQVKSCKKVSATLNNNDFLVLLLGLHDHWKINWSGTQQRAGWRRR